MRPNLQKVINFERRRVLYAVVLAALAIAYAIGARERGISSGDFPPSGALNAH
jgi:hypothetical protein